jgi:AraC-like DNA-binding protein
MISFGVLSTSLLIMAGQSVVLAVLLACLKTNVVANRLLAALIVAMALMVTPYIIGFAGFYDAFPWLSFAPFVISLAFGPLLYLHAVALSEGALRRGWCWHLAPGLIQFLNQALVFPLPLAMKDAWNSFVYEPVIDPFFDVASLASIAIYGWLVWRRYRTYRHFLAQNRADDARFDPVWLRNALIGVVAMAVLWTGFFVADLIDPSRDYFDKYWMYMALATLGAYLGIAGWRNGSLTYPSISQRSGDVAALDTPTLTVAQHATPVERDWVALGAEWARAVDAGQFWLDPELTLNSLARKLGTNTTYLSRALNEGLGLSFSGFINQRRVATAQALLGAPTGANDLMAVAFDAGFSSKASFNRAFSEFAGCSPSAWRQRARLKS